MTVQVAPVSFLGGLAGKSAWLVCDHEIIVLKADFDLEVRCRRSGRLQSNQRSFWNRLAGKSRALVIDADASAFHELAGTLSAEFCVVGYDFIESTGFGGFELFPHGLRLARWSANPPGSNGTVVDLPLSD